MATTPRTPITEPAVITGRGPYRSISRPTTIPASADTTAPVENAPTAAVADHPVSAVTAETATGNA